MSCSQSQNQSQEEQEQHAGNRRLLLPRLAGPLKFFGAASPQITLAAAAKLPRLRIPALIVWGADDTFFPLSDARRLADIIPDATLVEVPNGKTFVALDQPDAVADAIASFLKR